MKLNYQGLPDTKATLVAQEVSELQLFGGWEQHLGEKSLHICCYTLPAVVFPGHPLPAAVRGRTLSYRALSLTLLSVFVFLCEYSQHLSLLYRKARNRMEANETNVLQIKQYI